jgi:hypothetical protein
MAGARILYPQFRDEQSASRYPFSDSATLRGARADGVEVEIAADTFIDGVFFIIGGADGLYLSSITVAAQKITIAVSDAGFLKNVTADYNPLSPPVNGIINFFDVYGRPAGSLLSTPLNLARFSAWAVGTYSFAAAATEFVATVVIPANEPGVRALRPETKQFLTGDVWLVGDQGVVLRKEATTLADTNVIRIDIIGVPLFKRFLCEPQSESFPAKNYLKTINGCGPDIYGNFTITATNAEFDANTQATANTVLRVYPDNGTIVIDTASRSVS